MKDRLLNDAELWERCGNPAYLSAIGQERASELVAKGFLRRHKQEIVPNLLLFTGDQYRSLTALLDEMIQPHLCVAESLWKYAHDQLAQHVRRDLANQLPNLLDVKMGGLRHGVIQHLIDTGRLRWPEEPSEQAGAGGPFGRNVHSLGRIEHGDFISTVSQVVTSVDSHQCALKVLSP